MGHPGRLPVRAQSRIAGEDGGDQPVKPGAGIDPEMLAQDAAVDAVHLDLDRPLVRIPSRSPHG